MPSGPLQSLASGWVCPESSVWKWDVLVMPDGQAATWRWAHWNLKLQHFENPHGIIFLRVQDFSGIMRDAVHLRPTCDAAGAFAHVENTDHCAVRKSWVFVVGNRNHRKTAGEQSSEYFLSFLCGTRMYRAKRMMSTPAEDRLSGCVFYVCCSMPALRIPCQIELVWHMSRGAAKPFCL